MEPKGRIIKPKIRNETRKANDELAKDLNLPNEPWMQDWPYEVVNRDDIEKYLEYYNTTEDDDKKYILMEMLIQSTEEQPNEDKFLHYWNIIKYLIEEDFFIHEYTVWYWCLFEEIHEGHYEDHMEDAWNITPFLRELWHKMNLYFENLKGELKILLDYLNKSTVDAYFETISVSETKEHVNNILYKIENKIEIDIDNIKYLTSPTGAIQEISIDNGWGEEFLKIAERIDKIIENNIGKP